MSHLEMCVLHNASSENGFFANQRDSNSRTETTIRDVVHTSQRLNNQVLELVVGYNDLCRIGNTGEDGGQDGGLDGAPGYRRVGVLSPGSANFMDESEGVDHLGEALAVI